MPYEPHIRVRYQLASPDRIRNGRTVDIEDRPAAQSAILLASSDCTSLIPEQLTGLCTHQIVNGSWRQRWTRPGRMQQPAEGRGLAVSRFERVAGRLLPAGHVVYGIEDDGSCIWLVDEDECTHRIQNDMNDFLFRLAGDGLWVQCWLRRLNAPAPADLAPPVPLLMV